MILATRVTNRKRMTSVRLVAIVVLRVEVESKNEVFWLAAASLRDSLKMYDLARRSG